MAGRGFPDGEFTTVTLHQVFVVLASLGGTMLIAFQAFIGVQLYQFNGRMAAVEYAICDSKDMERRLDKVERHVSVCEMLMQQDPEGHHQGFKK